MSDQGKGSGESEGAKGVSRVQDLYAGGMDGTTVRIQMRIARAYRWSNRALDVKTAFLLAPLYQDSAGQPSLEIRDLMSSGTLDVDALIARLQSSPNKKFKIVVVSPPKILTKLGLTEPDEKWIVVKALYGLAQAPRAWAVHRDRLLRDIAWVHDGITYSLRQCQSDENLWRIVAIRPGGQLSLEGLVGVYVDDIMVTARPGVETRMVQELRQLWTTSEPEEATLGKSIRFCGFNVHALEGGGYLLNQSDYVGDFLSRFAYVQGEADTPCLKEEEPLEETPNPKRLKETQTLAGALQWVTTRTRPDIAFPVNKVAQLMSRFPEYSKRYAENILRYLRKTRNLGLRYDPLDETEGYGDANQYGAPRAVGLLEVFADASFAPGNGKSQTGVMRRHGRMDLHSAERGELIHGRVGAVCQWGWLDFDPLPVAPAARTHEQAYKETVV